MVSTNQVMVKWATIQSKMKSIESRKSNQKLVSKVSHHFVSGHLLEKQTVLYFLTLTEILVFIYVAEIRDRIRKTMSTYPEQSFLAKWGPLVGNEPLQPSDWKQWGRMSKRQTFHSNLVKLWNTTKPIHNTHRVNNLKCEPNFQPWRIISTVKQLPGFVYDKYFGGIEGPTGKTSRMNMSEGGC